MNWKIIKYRLRFNYSFHTLVFIGLILCSCNLKVISEEYRQLENSEWHQDSVLVFGINIPDSTKIYNLSFNVRNEGRYPYSNLWLFISVTPPRGKAVEDTVELTLADSYGKWQGSGLGHYYEKKYPYRKNVFFSERGEYSVKVRQGMRTEDGILKGIHDFGICLEKAY